MQFQNIPEFDEDRWYWLWDEAAVRQILTDANQDEWARYTIPKANDYAVVDPSNLPFIALGVNALAFDMGGTVENQRLAIRDAQRLLFLGGSAGAYDRLLLIARCSGYAEYQLTNQQRTGVQLYITPPPARAADVAFVNYITSRAKLIWPLDLDVVAVHILGSRTTEIKVTRFGMGIAYGSHRMTA